MPVRIRLLELFQGDAADRVVPAEWGDLTLQVTLVFDDNKEPVTAAHVEFTEKARGKKDDKAAAAATTSLPCQRRGLRAEFDIAVKPRTVVLERRNGYEAFEDVLITVSSKHRLLRIMMEIDPAQNYLADVIAPAFSEPLVIQTYDNGKRQNGVGAFTSGASSPRNQ